MYRNWKDKINDVDFSIFCTKLKQFFCFVRLLFNEAHSETKLVAIRRQRSTLRFVFQLKHCKTSQTNINLSTMFRMLLSTFALILIKFRFGMCVFSCIVQCFTWILFSFQFFEFYQLKKKVSIHIPSWNETIITTAITEIAKNPLRAIVYLFVDADFIYIEFNLFYSFSLTYSLCFFFVCKQ